MWIWCCCFVLAALSSLSFNIASTTPSDSRDNNVNTALQALSSSTSSSTLSLNDDEMLALEALYLKTNGEGWKWRKDYYAYGRPWNFTRSPNDSSSFLFNPCADEWQAVECSCNLTKRADLQVDDVFYNKGYYYDDDKVFENKSTTCHVVKLSLIDFRLLGTVPLEVGNLTRLYYLHLSRNLLSGNINFVQIDALRTKRYGR